MKPSYDPESYRWLIGEFCDALKMLAQENLVSPGAILYRKTQVVMPLRTRLVEYMRENYRETTRCPMVFSRGHPPFEDEENRTRKLGVTVVGDLLGFDHSSITLLEKRASLQEPKE